MILGIMRNVKGPLSRCVSAPLSPHSLLALWCASLSRICFLILIAVRVLEQLCP